jgi:hypothetical protein
MYLFPQLEMVGGDLACDVSDGVCIGYAGRLTGVRPGVGCVGLHGADVLLLLIELPFNGGNGFRESFFTSRDVMPCQVAKWPLLMALIQLDGVGLPHAVCKYCSNSG